MLPSDGYRVLRVVDVGQVKLQLTLRDGGRDCPTFPRQVWSGCGDEQSQVEFLRLTLFWEAVARYLNGGGSLATLTSQLGDLEGFLPPMPPAGWTAVGSELIADRLAVGDEESLDVSAVHLLAREDSPGSFWTWTEGLAIERVDSEWLGGENDPEDLQSGGGFSSERTDTAGSTVAGNLPFKTLDAEPL